jgi:two-component system chemotaxis sensor kinase CheA
MTAEFRASLSDIEALLAPLAEELAFISPGSDSGLLAINVIIMDLEQLSPEELPPQVAMAVGTARTWLDAILDGTGQFSEESVAFFQQWYDWMSEAITAEQTATPPPAWPENWAVASASAVEPTVVVAEPTPVQEVPAEEPATTVASAAPADANEATEERSITLNIAADGDLLREFHSESVELLQTIEQGLLVLEENPQDTGTINSIFRAFHTFKGGAGFLHLDAMRDLAHELESLLDAIRRGERHVSMSTIDAILSGTDALAHYIREIGAQMNGVNAGAPIVVPTSQVILRVQAALRGEPEPVVAPSVAPAAAPVAAPVESSPVPPPAAEPAATAQVAQNTVAVPKPTAAPTPAVAPVAAAPTPRAAPAARAEASNAGGADRDAAAGFVKLETSKLDSLINLVGELVIAQSMVVQNPDVQNINSLELVRSVRQLSRVTKELQRNATSLRMVPIRGLFKKMARLVRDLAINTQKQVQLVLDGEDTELDRNIVDKMADPLIHMIRNAIDHGLETPAERVAAGKSAVGTIRLSASHARGGIVIRIDDDGRGLNGERILRKAIEKGLVSPDAALTDSEVYSLIFLPGFSTADKVTDLSGRGVGMDVVRGNIESLRGKIETQSALGTGTTFKILLPLTLAIIDGLLVGVGKDRYIIPTLSVRESFRPRAGMVTSVQGRGEVVAVRGKQTPVLRLGSYIGTAAQSTRPEDGILIVVESGDLSRALLVDELIGKQEVVIKSLGHAFEQQDIVAGGAVLGDGWIGLILDVDTLVRLPQTPRAPVMNTSAGTHQ